MLSNSLFLQYCKLFRAPNLLMIALTQYLVRYFIINPFYATQGIQLQITNLGFALFVLATVFIAAAGYLINDYYDLKADDINKPNKVFVGRIISPSAAYITFYILSIIGCLLGLYIAWEIHFFNLGFLFVVCAIVLYFYSLRYKRLLLWGTLSVSIVLAFYSIINVWLFELFALRANPIAFGSLLTAFTIQKINGVILIYAMFAFLLSMIREIVKDNEDEQGDRAIECKSLILTFGAKVTKIVLFILTVLLMSFMAVVQVKSYSAQSSYFILTTVILLQIPLFIFLFKLKNANTKADYRLLSSLLKFVMLAGILSMIGIPKVI